jgi:NRPS condensation-like uncharacterized protein
VRGALIDLGGGRGQRLLLVIHHLVVDGVSWRILLEDLGGAYGDLIAGREVSLPMKTTSFQSWASALERYASSEESVGELDYWVRPRSAGMIPRDWSDGDNTVSSLATVSAGLSVDDTESLLREVPRVFHTQINDVLLTALALAMRDWSGSDTVLIDLEGHGREDLFGGVDLSRTVGWFTSIFPVELRLDGACSVSSALATVKRQLRAVPNKGVGYGVLRYLGPESVRSELEQLPDAEVSFNYLGRFEDVESGSRELVGRKGIEQSSLVH